MPGTPVRIIKHRRRVGGEFATLLDLFWREDEPWIVVRLPSGQRTATPISWTDLPAQGLAVPPAGPEILPSALLGLTQYCHGLRRARPRTSRAKGRARDKK